MFHGKSWEDKYGAFFDPETVAKLKRIVGNRIIVEISWVRGYATDVERQKHARQSY